MADAFSPEHGKRLEDPARLEALPQSGVVDLLRLRGDETVVDYGAVRRARRAGGAVRKGDRGRGVAGAGRPAPPEDRPRAGRETDGHRDRRQRSAPRRRRGDRVVMVDVLHHLCDQPEALVG
jgi:hypothetical protein